MNPNRAIALIRVSTEEQVNGPAAQRDALKRYAGDRGLDIVAWYEEVGVSGGAPLDARPTLWDAVQALRDQRAGLLLVAKRDRLARDTLAALLIEREVEGAGAQIVSADGNGNGSSPEAQLMRTILAGVAQYERAIIGARTRASLAARRAKGLRNGGDVPYGYRAVAGRLEPLEAEQATLRRIRELWPGTPVPAIVKELNENAEMYPPRGARWHLTSVYRICRSMSSGG